jgi:membrane protein implicated in regulation of membrane protease activity
MDALVQLIDGLTVWHWIGIAIILLTIEVAVGTFDLLWVAIAAFVTALFAWLVPPPLGGWQGELVCFGFFSVVLVIMGRTVFKGLRKQSSTHPQLNDRMAQMVGKRGEASSIFEGGQGQVKLGDTVWPARLTGDGAVVSGDDVIVTGFEGTTLVVRKS